MKERIRRNRSENRLAHKPSKRDLEWSERNLVESAEKYRLSSLEGEITHPNYIRIDNTNLSASAVAGQIWDYVSKRKKDLQPS